MHARRLNRIFTQLRADGRKALVIYLTAGDPNVAESVTAAQAAVAAGADILEVGIPFSDPMADGPVIQRAMGRALKGGGGFAGGLEVMAAIRAACAHVPIVAFGYLNPLLWDGLETACDKLHAAGADALLVVDVPSEEAAPVRQAAARAGLDWVPLLAPTSGVARATAIAAQGTGFVYLVSMTGVTGGEVHGTERLQPLIAAVRQAGDLPLCIGFGVRDAASARQMASLADGVVVGSAVVAQLEAGLIDASGPQRVGALVQQLRQGIDHP